MAGWFQLGCAWRWQSRGNEADDADEEASEDGEAELFVDGDELEDS